MSKRIDNKTYLNYLIQFLNVNDLKQICRDFGIKGFSKWKKAELIENILDSLSEEEHKELLEKKELDIISDSINLAIKKIKGEDRENIRAIRIVNEEKHEIEIDFKGFNWDTTSFLSINPQNINDPFRDCDCIIGSNMGFCSHFWIGFIISLKRNYFNLADWNLTVLPEDFEESIQTIKISAISGEEDKARAVLTLVDESSDDVELMKYINKSITIYEGEIDTIEKKQQQFQDIITTYYLASLNNVKFGPRIQRKSDFKEEDIEIVENLNIRISENLFEETNLKTGDKITTNGKLTKDNFMKMFIVKNIRKIKKI